MVLFVYVEIDSRRSPLLVCNVGTQKILIQDISASVVLYQLVLGDGHEPSSKTPSGFLLFFRFNHFIS